MAKYTVKKSLTENRLPYKEGDEIELAPERALQLGDLVEPKALEEKQIESANLENKMISSTDLMNKKSKSKKKIVPGEDET